MHQIAIIWSILSLMVIFAGDNNRASAVRLGGAEISRIPSPHKQPLGKFFSKPAVDRESKPFVSLIVHCEINGQTVRGIIDTGAQISIISSKCAQRCGISSYIDHRFKGKAIGVGTGNIIGQVNGLKMRIGPISFASTVAVLENKADVDFLIGLDFLRNFKGEISVRENVLKLQVRDKLIRIPFVNEASPFDSIDYSRHTEIDDSSPSELDDFHETCSQASVHCSASVKQNDESLRQPFSNLKPRISRVFGQRVLNKLPDYNSNEKEETYSEHSVMDTSDYDDNSEINAFDDSELSMEGI